MEGSRRFPARRPGLCRPGQTSAYTAAVSGRSPYTSCARGISSQRTRESVSGEVGRRLFSASLRLGRPHPTPTLSRETPGLPELRARRERGAVRTRLTGVSLVPPAPGAAAGTPSSSASRASA